MCLANLWISEGTNSLAHPFAHPKIIYCAPTICQPLWQMLRQDPSLSKLHIYIVSSKSLLINTLFTINIWNEILRIFEEVVCVYSVAQSCLTFCNCMYCSLPGSSVHGVFQARILECPFFSSLLPSPLSFQWFLASPSKWTTCPINIILVLEHASVGTRIKTFNLLIALIYDWPVSRGHP